MRDKRMAHDAVSVRRRATKSHRQVMAMGDQDPTTRVGDRVRLGLVFVFVA